MGMAQHEANSRFQNLRLNTKRDEDDAHVSDEAKWSAEVSRTYPGHEDGGGKDVVGLLRKENTSMAEERRHTPPITIPNEGHVPEQAVSPSETTQDSLEDFLRNRKTSISFSDKVKLDSGEKQSIDEPLEKPGKTRQRGRSLLQAMAEDKQRSERAHSESERTLYDPVTGRPLSRREQTSPSSRTFNSGESRHPLLQATVDELAREAAGERPVSLTSDSTLSPPLKEPETPELLQSPMSMLPRASSYDEKASPWLRQRRFGESRSLGELSQPPSLKSPRKQAARRTSSRQSTSAKSPASSFLRAFSISGRSDDQDLDREPSPDSEGQQIGDDYVLGKQIGYGGFSVIKEAWQGPNRRLAVKIVRRNIFSKSEAENDAAQAEFEHEVELWRFLKHKHILPLEAVYKTDFATFCFIPLNVGGTLFDLVRSNRQGLPLNLSSRYAAQLASAIRYLHEDAHVAHRDIKLENCLLDTVTTKLGSVRLCDFGMAEWISTDSDSYCSPPSPSINDTDRPPQRTMGPSESSTSAFAGGSLEYAAPEILRLSVDPHYINPYANSSTSIPRHAVNPAVDIWAYGVCIYALVVGNRPFQDSFQPRVTMSILRGEWNMDILKEKARSSQARPTSQSQERDQGEGLVDLISGCLIMDQDERWNIRDVISSKWLEKDLRECLDDDDDDLDHHSSAGAVGSGDRDRDRGEGLWEF